MPADGPEDSEDRRADVEGHLVQSLKWSWLGAIAPRFVTPLVTVLLSLLLSPRDFGLAAAGTAVVSIAYILVSVGPAIIRSRGSEGQVASTAFWLGNGLMTVLYLLIWAASGWYAQRVGDPALETVIRVAGLALFLSTSASVPISLLQKRFDFSGVFVVSVARAVVGSLVSISLALLSMGYWALVLGPLAGLATGMVVAFWRSRWWPGLALDRATGKSLLAFSAWVSLASLVTWCFGQADNLLCGAFLGPEKLGVYAFGFNLTGLVPGLIISPLASVAYTAFCKVQNDPREMAYLLGKYRALAAVLLVPTAAGTALIARPFVRLVWGETWPGLELVLICLAIMPGLAHVWSLDAEAFRAMGRPDLWPKLGLVAVVLLFPALWVGAAFDLQGFLIGRALASTVVPVLVMIVAHRLFSGESGMGRLWSPFAAAAVMVVAILGIQDAISRYLLVHDAMLISITILVGASIYVGALAVLDRRLLVSFLRFLRQVIGGRAAIGGRDRQGVHSAAGRGD